MTRRIRTLLFGISLQEATFQRRRFPDCAPQARERLESIGFTFLTGYLAALEASGAADLAACLDTVEPERRGFAYEGAAMALGLMDILLPWRRDRWRSFTEGHARHHEYMMQVGLGWAIARMHRNVPKAIENLDPLIRWLAVDGYGFHECYFKWERVMGQQQVPRAITGYSRNAFDQGLGRCLWFVNGCDPERVADVIGRFPRERRSDLWSGAGLASAYAGGVEPDALAELKRLSGTDYPALAQGVVFATETRVHAGNPAPHTELACTVICGMPVEQASSIVANERRALPYHAPLPAFEVWRKRIQAHFTDERAEAFRSTPRNASAAAFNDSRSSLQ